MIRRLWCPKCKTIVDTVVIHGKETCPRCGECLTCGESFVSGAETKSA